MELDHETLTKLHDVQFEALSELDRVMSGNGIRYYLIGGTLLGAARYRDFIPWDDDVDLCIMRKDYGRFRRACKYDLHKRYFLQTYESDPNYSQMYPKLRVNGTLFREKSLEGLDCHKGIFIDVFIMDQIPERRWQKRFHQKLIMILNSAVLLKMGAVKVKHPVNRAILGMISLLPRKALGRLLDAACGMFRRGDHAKICNLGGAYGYEQESVEKSYFRAGVPLEFHGRKFQAPEMWKEYLTHIYGDYMTPPPEAKRKSGHDVLEIDFGT